MAQYPNHKLALPECLYVPDLQDCFPLIADLNQMLKEYQIRNDMNAYGTSKTGTRQHKGSISVRQSLWEEYQKGEGRGYFLNAKGKQLYVNYIKRFHNTAFQKEGRDTRERFAVEKNRKPPKNVMKLPDLRRKIDDCTKESDEKEMTDTEDMRQKVNKIKRRKVNELLNVKVENPPPYEEWLKMGTPEYQVRFFQASTCPAKLHYALLRLKKKKEIEGTWALKNGRGETIMNV